MSGSEAPPAAAAEDLLELLPGVAGQGDLAWFDYGGSRRLLVNDPAEIHRVLARGTDAMRATPVTDAVRRVLGDGLLTASAPRWRPRRVVVQRELSRSAVREVADVVAANTRAVLAGWSAGQLLDLKAEMNRLALDNLGDAVFGGDFRAYRDTVGRAVEATLDALDAANAGRLDEAGRSRLDRAVDELDAFVGDLLAARSPDGHDRLSVLDVLLREAGAGAPEFADPWVRDEAVTLIMAGHDTVAFTAAMALLLLGEDPGLLARLRAEVTAALDAGTDVADLPETAPLARRVVEETLRLYPPVPILHRTAPPAFSVGDREVPEGTILVLSPWVTQRDGRYFPDPLRFDPERFSAERRAEIPRYSYFPFGAGPRVCVGNHFALLETVVVVSLVSVHADLQVDMVERPRVTAPVGLRFPGPVPALVRGIRRTSGEVR